MKTKNSVPFKTWLHHKRQALSFYARVRIGSFCYYAIQRFKDYKQHLEYAKKPRLDKSDIEALVALQADQVDHSSEYRVRSWRITDGTLKTQPSIYTQAATVALEILENRKDISSVLNIGARVDVISAYLAKKFPGVEFYSVDIQENLEQHNKDLPGGPNWHFVSGYALDLLERKQIRGDLAIFTSTACLFTNLEFRAYCKALSENTRFVIFNEPFGPVLRLAHFTGMQLPEDIDAHESEVGAQHPIKVGAPFFFMHSYPAILNDYGYRIKRSELILSPLGDFELPRLFLVAERTA